MEELSIAALEGELLPSEAEVLPGLPLCGVKAQVESNAELAALLSWETASIRLEWNPPPCPKCSQLDDWFLGSECDVQPCSTPVPFFPEVHDELMKSWKAHFSTRTRLWGSSALTTLDGASPRGTRTFHRWSVQLRCIYARKIPPPGGPSSCSSPSGPM